MSEILARLRRHAAVGPALFTLSQEDAQRLVAHIDGQAPVTLEEVMRTVPGWAEGPDGVPLGWIDNRRYAKS